MADDQKTIASVAIELEAKLGKALEDGLTKIHGQMADVQELVMKMGKAISDNLASPMSEASKSTKSLADTAYDINKILEISNTLSKMESDDYESMVKSLNEAGVLQDSQNEQLKIFVDGVKQAKKLEEESNRQKKQARILEEEFNVDIRKDIRDIDSLQKKATESQKERDKERIDLYKDMTKSTGRAVADFFGLGDIYEKAWSAGKKVKDALSKLFEPNKATNMMAERALKIRNLMNKTDKSNVPIEKLHTKNKLKEFKNEQQLMKDKKVSKLLTGKELEDAIKHNKISGKRLKDSIKSHNAKITGGGKPPVPPSGAAGAAGGGGEAAMMMASRGAMVGIGAAAGAAAVVVGVIVAGVLLLAKALSTASAVMEEFHTINFMAAGGQRQLAIAIADVTLAGPFLVKEVQEATKALAEAGFTTETLTANNNKLISDITAYTRVTGVSADVTAKLIKTHRGLGGTMGQAKEQLGAIVVAMQKFGLTAQDAENILSTMNEMSSKLNVTMGYSPKQIAGATNAMAQLAGSAKRLGFDVSDATGFFKDLTDNAEKFIVATKGKSLFQGPTETLSMLVRDSDKILQNLQKFKPGVICSQMMNQLYGMNDKQLRMIMDLKDQHTKWAENEKNAALSRGESLEKLDLSEKTFLEASKQSKETMDNIDKLAKQSAENVGRQWDLAKAKVEAALLRVGAVLMPIFVKAMDWVVGAFKTIFGWWANFFKMDDVSSDITEFQKALKEAEVVMGKSAAASTQMQRAEQVLANLAKQRRDIDKDKSLDNKIKQQKLKDIEEQTQAAKEAIEELGVDGSKSFDEYSKNALANIQKSAEEKDKAATRYLSKMAAENKAVESKSSVRKEQWAKALGEQKPNKIPEPQPMRPAEKDKINDMEDRGLSNEREDTKAQDERVKHTAELEKQTALLKELTKKQETHSKNSKFSDSITWN